MARFYLGKDGSGRDLYGDGGYSYVDLRGRIPGSPQPNQGTVYKDAGVVFHYNGPKVVHSDLDQLWIDARYHMRPNAFGPGATPNGIQYEWAIGHDGTKYRLRNPGASLWHCGNAHHNERSFAATFLIGEGQRITAAAKESARELADALLRIQGLGRSACRGHRDVNPSECPGSAYTDFVLPYRAGKFAPAPKPPAPKPTGRPEYVYAIAWAKPDVDLAKAAVSAMKNAGYPNAVLMATAGDVEQASIKAHQQDDRPALVIGGPTVEKMHPEARAAFKRGNHARLLDCVGTSLEATTEEIAWRLSALAPRLGVDKARLVRGYRNEVSKIPNPAKPSPPKKAYTARDFAVLNDFRMWPAAARDCARIANEFGLTPAAFSTYANVHGRHGDAPPGGSVDILISDRYGKWANANQLAFGKRIVRWLYGEYDSGRMGLDYVVFNKVYNHFNGVGDQPYDPNWSLGKSPVSDDHGDHIHITWLA